jgi:hypothetical protein
MKAFRLKLYDTDFNTLSSTIFIDHSYLSALATIKTQIRQKHIQTDKKRFYVKFYGIGINDGILYAERNIKLC